MNARLNPFFDSNPKGGRNSVTFPHGFLDFLNVGPGRRHRVGQYELEPERLDNFNAALRGLSPEAPGITMDQIATAAQRALQRHVDGSTPRSCSRGWRHSFGWNGWRPTTRGAAATNAGASSASCVRIATTATTSSRISNP